jgi:hypothetical protein
VHTWEPLVAPRLCTWIGLNPSVANEAQLDPTLRRIRAFSAASGFNGFIMTKDGFPIHPLYVASATGPTKYSG